MKSLKGIAGYFTAPSDKKNDDGRDQWQSRTSYLLASMGGAIGFGNMLRYPSQVFNNNGAQWFISYLLALALLAIPVLILEVSIGQSLRGGSVIAYNGLERRTRGVGLGMICIGVLVCVYYVPMLSWVLMYFRHSFQSPLPWEGRGEDFYMLDVVQNPDPINGVINDNGLIESFRSYPGSGLIGEAVGWTAFSWFLVWLCLYKGIQTTGKAVYVTMGLPIIIVIILDGIKLYIGEFNGEQLQSGQIYLAALGQVFYSTGVGFGFGYFTAYASYNRQNANAVQDSIIICCCNAVFEVVAAFAVFGVMGFLGMTPDPDNPVGTFTLGFLTLPEGLAQMPGAQFWSVLFFLILFLLGMSSSFVMIDALITTICDTDFGQKTPRIYISTSVIVVCFLVSLMYTSEFGYYLLDSIDTMTNNIALPFVVLSECIAATVVYRYIDIVGQVGWIAFIIHNFGYLGGLLIGLTVAHTVGPIVGVPVGFGLYLVCFVVSVLVAQTPESQPPRFWARNTYLSRSWWLACYSGNQLRRDLNVTVASGKNWSLPVYWAPCLRYITAPILAITFSFSYPTFWARRSDPLDIFAFGVAHLVLLLIVSAFCIPRFLSPLVPKQRKEEGVRMYAPQVLLGMDGLMISYGIEEGDRSASISDDSKEPTKENSHGSAELSRRHAGVAVK